MSVHKKQNTRRKQRSSRIQKGRGKALENVLGLVAAQGYGETVLPKAKQLSKVTAKNIHTEALYPVQPFGFFKRTPLHLAVENADLEAVRRILAMPTVKIDQVDRNGASALDRALVLLITRQSKGANWETNPKTDSLIQILDELTGRTSDFHFLFLSSLWNLNEYILEYILFKYPHLQEKIFEKEKELFEDADLRLDRAQSEINISQHEDGYVPGHMYTELNDAQEAIENLQWFINSFAQRTNSEQGANTQNSNS